MNKELLQRWRLILGKNAEEEIQKQTGSQLEPQNKGIDEALGALYESSGAVKKGKGKVSYADLGDSSPKLAEWLGDIRSYFSDEIVAVIQKDAIERKGLDQLLYEPELLSEVEPELNLIGLLLSLKEQIPDESKNIVREIVKKVVERIKALLEDDIRQAVIGSRNRFEHSVRSSSKNIDWKKTIDRNLKNWDEDRKTIVPEKVYFYSNSLKRNNWTVLVNLDQSGSMAESVIYGTVMGSIFASLPALETRVVAFDTNVVDLSEECGDDPVDMLMGVQLGGGTNINKSIKYSSQFIHTPSQTIFILISDLFEAGNENELLTRVTHLVDSGVRFICLLSLSDQGAPFYNDKLARKLTNIGVPCFACTPEKIPELIQNALKGNLSI